MMAEQIYLFGYGRHGRRIAAQLTASGYRLHIFETAPENVQHAREDDHANVDVIDVTDDAQIAALEIAENDRVVCVMDDEHLNVFLTLSLRQFYPTVRIYSISDSIHTEEKLIMAGATKVIDLYQVSATRIHNFLHRPVAAHLLSGILGHERNISIREFVIPEGSFLHGVYADTIDFNRFNLLFMGLIDVELSHELIFVTEGIRHKLDSGDTLVFMAKDDDLDRFADTIRRTTL